MFASDHELCVIDQVHGEEQSTDACIHHIENREGAPQKYCQESKDHEDDCHHKESSSHSNCNMFRILNVPHQEKFLLKVEFTFLFE